MNKCPNCGHENRAGEIICSNCGTNLLTGEKPTETKKLDKKHEDDLTREFGDDILSTDTASGADIFPSNATLRLEIVGSPLPINVKFSKPTLTLGRRDPATGALPDIDLAPFAGYRMGVSRRHSQIRRADEGYLELFDLGSSNGTFLNGQRLNSHTPYRLNNYDRVALGQIVFQVVFRVPAEESILEDKTEGATKSSEAPARDSVEMSSTKKVSSEEFEKIKADGESEKSGLPGTPTGKLKSDEVQASKPSPDKPAEGNITRRNIKSIKVEEDESKQPPATEQKADEDKKKDEK
jgi:pSer/pThr/pTyr-binding forkhead associated (FHA) protein